MSGKFRIAFLIAIVAAAIAVAAVSVNTNNEQPSDEDISPSVYVGVDVDGNDKTILVAGEDDYFKEGLNKNDLLVYYIVLDSYLDENNIFDAEKYYGDLTDESYDFELGEYLPSFTKKINDFQAGAFDSKNVYVSFSAQGEYAAYIIGFKNSGLNGLSSFPVSVFDLPDPIFEDKTPAISVVSELYENTNDISIIVEAENTKFTSVDNEDIYLYGCIESLDVTGVAKIDDYTIEIQTKGVLSGATAYLGYVCIAEGATDCGYDLSAMVMLTGTLITIDERSLKVSDNQLDFDILISDSIHDSYGSIVLNETTYYFNDAKQSELKGFWVIPASILVPYDSVYDSIDLLNGYTITAFDPSGKLPQCEFDVNLLGAVLSAGSSSYTITTEGDVVFEISILAIRGYVKDISKDDLILECTNKDATIIYADNERIEIKVPGFIGPTFNAIVTVKHGVMNPWGTEASNVALDIMTCVDTNDTDIVKKMVEEIYSSTKFTDMFGYISLALGGVDLVISILGSVGVIDTTSATDIQLSQILSNTEQIKLMLAEQSKTLAEMNQKLDKIVKELEESKLREYSNYYSELIEQNNKLSMAIAKYSNALKTMTWDVVTGKYDGKTMYFYFTEDGKISITPGSLFVKYENTKTIDGKKILPQYTYEIPIIEGVTFDDANDGKGYSKDTEAKMIACMTKAIKEKYSEFYFVELPNGKRLTFPASTLAREAFNCMTVKFAQDLAKDSYGENILSEYYLYTEKMASLEVDAQGTVVINTLLFKSNPTLASQYILQSNYNFESEARANLTTLNDCITLRLFQYTLVARQIEQLQGSGSDLIEKHYNKAVEFLKGHRGYRTGTINDEYCYVSNSYVKIKGITLDTQTVTTNKRARTIIEPPIMKIGVKSAEELGIPSTYIDDTQFQKIYSNFLRLYKTDKPETSFTKYIGTYLGLYMDSSYIITKFEGGEYFSDERGVTLYSRENLTSSHEKTLLKAGNSYVIKGTVDAVGRYKAYSSDVYSKVAYMGKVFDMFRYSYAAVPTEIGNCIFASAVYCDHVSAWKYDEGATLTPDPNIRISYSNEMSYHSKGYSNTITMTAYYNMIQTYFTAS